MRLHQKDRKWHVFRDNDSNSLVTLACIENQFKKKKKKEEKKRNGKEIVWLLTHALLFSFLTGNDFHTVVPSPWTY